MCIYLTFIYSRCHSLRAIIWGNCGSSGRSLWWSRVLKVKVQLYSLLRLWARHFTLKLPPTEMAEPAMLLESLAFTMSVRQIMNCDFSKCSIFCCCCCTGPECSEHLLRPLCHRCDFAARHHNSLLNMLIRT